MTILGHVRTLQKSHTTARRKEGPRPRGRLGSVRGGAECELGGCVAWRPCCIKWRPFSLASGMLHVGRRDGVSHILRVVVDLAPLWRPLVTSTNMGQHDGQFSRLFSISSINSNDGRRPVLNRSPLFTRFTPPPRPLRCCASPFRTCPLRGDRAPHLRQRAK